MAPAPPQAVGRAAEAALAAAPERLSPEPEPDLALVKEEEVPPRLESRTPPRHYDD